jgi:hypothetical protein
LLLDDPLRPRAQRRDTVQIPEGGVVVVSHDSVGPVGDDGTDEAALVGEIVRYLRAAGFRRLADVLEARVRGAVLVHQASCRVDNPSARRTTLRGQPRVR